jgi:hypothetical protein
MPCGIVRDKEFFFDIPGAGNPMLVVTRGRDKPMALRKAYNELLRSFEYDFQSEFGDMPLPEEEDLEMGCSIHCPLRTYLISVTYEFLEVKEVPGRKPGFTWAIKARGKYRLMIFCVSESQRISAEQPVGGGGQSRCGQGIFHDRRSSTASRPLVNPSDINFAGIDATERAYRDMFFISSHIQCPKTCPMRVVIYHIVEKSYQIHSGPGSLQEMVTATVTWDLRVDCVPAKTTYSITEGF